ncbi:MAG: hypothetical protein M1833_006539 [Piccolia ochrophora]|nr:MAG: hypothetical protein M1833_006539 [Piccolia ochrophora]
MLSGGADASITLWDLEAEVKPQSPRGGYTHRPRGSVPKGPPDGHSFGVTHLSFYPFDSLAFLSSSYDHTLKIYATDNLRPSASFDLDSVVYSHALSPIASHLLVACATQHPTVRVVDLRSGASTHSLAGHAGAVLSVAWSPHEEYILASGGADGVVRIWDVRRSVGELGVLDVEDAVGIEGYDGLGLGARRRMKGQAHGGAVNGVAWVDDGRHLITTGLDERIRVWDVARGANTLASFGPVVKNAHLSTLLPLNVPSELLSYGKHAFFFPSNKEILCFDLFEGHLLKRLQVSGPATERGSPRGGQRKVANRATSLTWRVGSVELYSAHADGKIRAWMPRTEDDVKLDETAEQERRDGSDDASRKRKKQVLDDVYQDLTRKRLTFG